MTVVKIEQAYKGDAVKIEGVYECTCTWFNEMESKQGRFLSSTLKLIVI